MVQGWECDSGQAEEAQHPTFIETVVRKDLAFHWTAKLVASNPGVVTSASWGTACLRMKATQKKAKVGNRRGEGNRERERESVTKSGVRLLAALKPRKRQAWWKGKSALFHGLATWCGSWAEGGRLSEGRLPPTDKQGARAFIDGGRGLHMERAESALTVILKLVLQWSDQHHLDCFKYS